MERGFVKLYRKTLDSGLLQHPTALQLFTFFLLSATRKPRKVMANSQLFELAPGELVTSVAALTHDLGMTTKQCRLALAFLERASMVTIRGTNKGSVISLVNWARYQEEGQAEGQTERQADGQAMGKQPPSHHINKQERENIKKRVTREKSEALQGLSDVMREAVTAFAEHRKNLKAPLTDQALKLTLAKLQKLAPGDEARQVAILEQSVERGWKGIFALKENEPSMIVPAQRYEWKSPAQRRLEANMEAAEAFVRGETGLENFGGMQ